MNYEFIFKKYLVRKLTPSDVNERYELCKFNLMYYEYCPPFVTKEGILEDLKKLPPKKTAEDKYYLGIYLDKTLICVLDLILDYPQKHTAFIGFFMLDKNYQGKGIGSEIFQELSDYLFKNQFTKIRLAYVKGNQQSEHFWKKNGFHPVGLEIEQDSYIVVVLEKNIGNSI